MSAADPTPRPVRRPADVALSDHVRPTDDDGLDGVYRVVGRSEERVTLLRVADATGTRRHTGELVTVSRTDLDGFVIADAPNASGRSGRLSTRDWNSCTGPPVPSGSDFAHTRS